MTIQTEADCLEAEATARALRRIFDQMFDIESNCRDGVTTHSDVADVFKTAGLDLKDVRETLAAEMSDVEAAIKEWRGDEEHLVGQSIRPRPPRPSTGSEQQRDCWRSI